MTASYVLGIDFGLKYIGLAVGQTITNSANGLTTLKAKNGVPDWHQLIALIEQYKPATLVVGLPLNMDGTESPMSERARSFAHHLEHALEQSGLAQDQINITLIDERLSSWQANGETKRLPKERDNHEQAACLIAETWMNEQP